MRADPGGWQGMMLAVMQPYFFPYLGYYQLAASVDHFVFLDDAAFIERGFINRNRILLQGRPFRFTLPVVNASQNRPINQHRFVGEHCRFMQQLQHAYKRAPFFEKVFPMIDSICRQAEQNVAQLCAGSVRAVFAYLHRPLSASYASQFPSEVRGQARILELCQQFGADAYHNASGGRELYDAGAFREKGIRLRFLQGRFPCYQQGDLEAFVPALSMIDVLMHNAPEVVNEMLLSGELEDAA